jgi:predicted nucleic acid-binding Zn ribbon protein
VRIAEALSSALARLGVEPRLREHEVFRIWASVVGEAIARHAEPQGLKHGRLLVHVTDPIWLHQLSMMRHRILEVLRARLGPAVRELVLRIGEVSPRPAGPGQPEVVAVAPPDPRRLAEIETILAPLKDEPARQAFRRLLLRHERLGGR